MTHVEDHTTRSLKISVEAEPSSLSTRNENGKVIPTVTSEAESVLFSEQMGKTETAKDAFGEIHLNVEQIELVDEIDGSATRLMNMSRNEPINPFSPDLKSLTRFVAPPNAHPDRMTAIIDGSHEKHADVDLDSETSDESDEEDSDDEPESYHSGDSSEYDMAHRHPLERAVVKKDIIDVHQKIQGLRDPYGGWNYKIVDRLGEGKRCSAVRLLTCRYIFVRLPCSRSAS